jgi:hypothetical protein
LTFGNRVNIFIGLNGLNTILFFKNNFGRALKKESYAKRVPAKDITTLSHKYISVILFK